MWIFTRLAVAHVSCSLNTSQVKSKLLALVSAVAILVPASARADTRLEWDVFGSTYAKASFSFTTEPIVVSATDVRKYTYSTLAWCESLKKLNTPQTDCIEKVEASVDGKNWIQGRFDSYMPIGHKPTDIGGAVTPQWATGDVELPSGTLDNNVQGSRSGIWKFPGVVHSEGDQFLVSYQIGAPAYNNKINYLDATTEMQIQPVATTLIGSQPAGEDKKNNLSTWVKNQQCFIGSTYSYCIKFLPFANENIKFRVSVNLKIAEKSLTSETWMYAHASSVRLNQTSKNGVGGGQELVFEASPVSIEIPTVVMKTKAEVIAYADSLLAASNSSTSSNPAKKIDPSVRDNMITIYSKGVENGANNSQYGETQNSFAPMSTYFMGQQEPFVTVENTREYTGLQFRTLPLGSAGTSPELFQVLKNCPANDHVAGVISSNASAVETSPPLLDKSTMTLKYRVAAPHLKSNGDLNTGFYKLQMNPEIAKCIWGNNLAGAKAEVSILNDSGQAQVAASTFTFTDEAANFEIAGFHYSAGSINMKLVLPKQEVTKPTTPTSSPKTPAKNLTIVCYKGKLIKKVTGASPKCPAGYKKR